jgi:hypothetical protein
VRVHNQDCPHLDSLSFTLHQLLFQRINDIFLKTRLVIGFSSEYLHTCFVAEVEFKAAIVGFSGQNSLTGCAEGVCEDVVQSGCCGCNLDVGASDGDLGTEVLIDVRCEGGGEAWTTCCAIGVAKCCTRDVDLKYILVLFLLVQYRCCDDADLRSRMSCDEEKGIHKYGSRTFLAKSSKSLCISAFSAVANEMRPSGLVSGSYVVPFANCQGISS